MADCINCADAELDQLNNDPPNNMTDYLPNMYELALLNISSHFDLAMTWVSPAEALAISPRGCLMQTVAAGTGRLPNRL